MKGVFSIEKRILEIKEALLALEDMHPGRLIDQPCEECGRYRCEHGSIDLKYGGAHAVLVYKHKGHRVSRVVRSGSRARIQKQVDNYKAFRALMSEWLDLARALAQLKLLGLDEY